MDDFLLSFIHGGLLLSNIHFPSGRSKSILLKEHTFFPLGPPVKVFYVSNFTKGGPFIWTFVNEIQISSRKTESGWSGFILQGALGRDGGPVPSIQLPWSCPVSTFLFPFFRCLSESIHYPMFLLFVFNKFIIFYFAQNGFRVNFLSLATKVSKLTCLPRTFLHVGIKTQSPIKATTPTPWLSFLKTFMSPIIYCYFSFALLFQIKYKSVILFNSPLTCDFWELNLSPRWQ